MWPGDEAETLYPRKTKWYAIFVVSTVFTAGGCWVAAFAGAPGDRLMGYASCALFGLIATISLLLLVPGSSFLQITPEGIAIRTLWRTQRYGWSDFECFGLAEIATVHQGVTHRHRRIGFNFSEVSQHRTKSRRFASLNERLSGFQAALPDNYGWDPPELAEHLNQLLEKYGAS